MQLAVEDMFRARWTNAIHEEWMSNLLANRPDLTRPKLERVRDLMNRHARDSLVEGYEHLISSIYGLPDPDDRHVVAAARKCGADAIITFNLRDFPDDALHPYGLEVIHPDDFIHAQMTTDPSAVLKAAQTCRARLINPPQTADQYLNRLALTRTAAQLRSRIDLI